MNIKAHSLNLVLKKRRLPDGFETRDCLRGDATETVEASSFAQALQEQPAATVSPTADPRPFHDDAREDEPEVVALLTRPYINARGELIIPFNADPRFHWWNAGQSILDTLRELGAPPEVVARYVDSDASLKKMQ